MNMNKPKESHAEFYAEIIGKLIGSVRSGIRTFIDDVKKGRREKNNTMNEEQSALENNLSEANFENSTLKFVEVI